MTNKIIKVDRVRSAAEAAALESLGASMIGVELDPNPRFRDSRTLTVEQAAEIRRALPEATLTVAMDLDNDPNVVHRLARATGADLIQPIAGTIPPFPVRAAGIGIVYAGLEISHDDDPAWIFSAHDDTPDLNAAFFQVDVLPEYRESWAFLRDRSPEYEDEFQIRDLDALGSTRPLLVGLDFKPDNVREIAAGLPHVRGWAFTLADQAERKDVHFHSFPDAIKALDS